MRRARRALPDFDPLDLFGQPDSIRPAPEERLEPLFCDVALRPDEARRGGVLPLRIPIREVCPACHGAGHVCGFGCRRCDATGDALAEITIPLEVPAGVHSGAILDLPLDRRGIRNLWLRVGLGLRELSMSPARAARVRHAITRIDCRDAEALASEALACRTSRDATDRLTHFVREHLGALHAGG